MLVPIRKKHSYRNVSCGAALLISWGALAQSSPPAVFSPSQEAPGGLDEVIVTATRRRERLEDVPVADTVFDSEFLERSRVQSTTALTQYTPGLNAFSSGETTNFYVRGIGTSDFSLASDADVPVFIDDVYIGRPGANTLDLVNIASIEVLKGPQGTLVGRNSVAGAINITSRAPGDTLAAESAVSLGNFDERRVLTSIDFPLIADLLNASVTGLYDEDDGIRRDVTTNTRLDNHRALGGRIVVALVPAESVKTSVTFDDESRRGRTPAYRSYSPLFQPGDAQNVENNFNPSSHTDTTGASVRTEWTPTGFFSYIGIAGWRRFRLGVLNDDDGTSLPATVALDDQLSEEGSLELRAVSKGEGPLKLVLGASSFLESTREGFGFFVGEPLLDTLLTASGLPTGIVDPYVEVEHAKGENHSNAVYADGTYDLTPSVSVSVGMRYTIDRKSVTTVSDPSNYAVALASLGIPGIPNFFDPATINGSAAGARTYYGVTPRGALTYKWTSNISSYLSVTRGYKAGGYNSSQVAPDGLSLLPPFQPETVLSYEIGLKGDFLDRRVRLDVAAYHYDYSDLQLLVPLGTALIYRGINANASGVEMDLTARPTNDLTLIASAAYEKSKILDGIAGVSQEGAQLPLAPQVTASVVADYTRPLNGVTRLECRAEGTVKTREFFDTLNTAQTAQGFLPLFSARFAIADSAQRWRVALWARNLANRAYTVNGLNVSSIFGYSAYVPGDPRTFGIEITSHFGTKGGR